MKITFLLPSIGRYPLGGFRIVYEHANRLAERGHVVTVMHVITALPKERTLWSALKGRALYVRYAWTGQYRPDAWFSVNPRVSMPWHYSLSHSDVPDGDAVIATAWQTADFVAGLPAQKGKKFYFIQHFEDWACSRERLLGTWRLPLHKIVVARWLQDIAHDEGETATYVPNAVDYDFFKMNVSPSARGANSVLLQAHNKDWKGTDDAIAALSQLHEEGEALDVTIFSQHERDLTKINWPYRYEAKPSQARLRALYNQAAIFVAPSWSEGWGLTAHEAAACGAAIVATDIGGHREFLRPSYALLSDPKKPRRLAENIKLLKRDSDHRAAIALAGREAVLNFTWGRSSRMFEEALAQ